MEFQGESTAHPLLYRHTMNFGKRMQILILCLTLAGVPSTPPSAHAGMRQRFERLTRKYEAPACDLLQYKKMNQAELQNWIHEEEKKGNLFTATGQITRALPLAAAMAPLVLVGVVTLPVGIAISAGAAILAIGGGTFLIAQGEDAQTQVDCAKKVLDEMQIMSDAASPKISSLERKNIASTSAPADASAGSTPSGDASSAAL